MAITMLAFVRNRSTNALPLLLGLFFKISGTSTRVLSMLSNIGVCVSSNTVERLKKRISEDAIAFAVDLIKSGQLFCVVFDNINIFQRKFQQRTTNRNSMINATNCAIIGIDGADTAAEDLDAKLSMRGNRAQATPRDIFATQEDDAHMKLAFEALIADMLVRYCPGSTKWEDRTKMLEEILAAVPTDRPLKAEKTDTRPFGVFDVNEGSKKGLIKVLEAIRERSTLTVQEWSAKARIIIGDWLTANNLRAARRDRTDDVNAMERVDYPEELSALWHYALQATHMIMRTHYGHAVLDPSSLAAHKGLLHRVWDVNKPNYAAAKALIRHSLIARLLHIAISKEIGDQFTTTTAAENAKDGGDDYLAHEIYFIRDALFFCEFEHAISYADAGRHNYARECLEVLLKWKYELTTALRTALEKSWFVNRWGIDGRWIPADLYLEQLNFWVK
ncbi:hypothetical protein PLICRDRAFT_59103, partial [Plicaturopsis crispa FD-325 SS-3]